MDDDDGGGDVGSGARKFGEKLMGEVERVGLSELLSSLRDLSLPEGHQHFTLGIPELDALIAPPPSTFNVAQQPPQAPPAHPRSDDDVWTLHSDPPPAPRSATSPKEKDPRRPPILELVSPPHTHHPSPAGKTSLLHLITTHAVLPPTFSHVPLGGNAAAIVIIDPLSHFNITRLAQVMLSFIADCFRRAGRHESLHDAQVSKDIIDLVKHSLHHVHVFRPASWPSLLATLAALPEYLLGPGKHASMRRAVRAVVVEDVGTFVAGIRSGTYGGCMEGFMTTTTTTTTTTNTNINTTINTNTNMTTNTNINPLTTASTLLTTHLTTLSKTFNAAILLTTAAAPSSSSSSGPSSSSFRPGLPVSTAWPPGTHVARVAVRRVEVPRFGAGDGCCSVEGAEAERELRWEVVRRGRFECWGVGRGSASASASGSEKGKGFVFRVGEGVEVERGGE